MIASPFAPSAEDGFTLIELLVAALCAVLVIGAAFGALEFALKQEGKATDRVEADATGRTALTSIINELHSSCTGFGTTAIQGPASTPSSPLASTGALNLWFLSEYGNSTSGEAVPTGITEHDINWTSTGTSKTGSPLGTLTDYQFVSTGGTSPNWQFPELKTTKAKAVALATNVVPPEVSGASTIFQYYKLEHTSSESTNGRFVAIGSSEVAAAAEKKQVAKVTITFSQAPPDANTETGHTATLSDSVVLRFTSPEPNTEITNGPCE
jgi:Tfp pilus assembly protein PilW